MRALLAAVLFTLGPSSALVAAEPLLSEASEECIACHETLHPGIVAQWRQSRHARVSPAEGLEVEGLARRVSSGKVPEALRGTVVGCAECHGLRPKEHADTFDHNGYDVHLVVSPRDCALCHAEEAAQYDQNLMAHAMRNLAGNTLYNDLERCISGRALLGEAGLEFKPPTPSTRADGCFYCHGTELKLTGRELRETDLGELEFPVIEGWPNQGVGRINLDGSRGACSACHSRHDFSIAMARKPYTCKECHVGPDVPAFKVYEASKHGNIFSAQHAGWDFDAVPWKVGRDFTAPTCASCHVSLLVGSEDEVVAERTHRMTDRLAWRIFGLPYAHPQPKAPDTTPIRNAEGLPLPTSLGGQPAMEFLIGEAEQAERRSTMQAVCLACHGTSWVRGHFAKVDEVIAETNASVRVATALVERAWSDGLAEGPAAGGSPFDEAVERRWLNAWLFYANSVRFSSAMGGGGDYGVFADGRYALAKSLAELHEWVEQRSLTAGEGSHEDREKILAPRERP